ncbi:MAG: right-handed parallel beta-helix repeat-containing protein [Phycisphaeraceae bacterium]
MRLTILSFSVDPLFTTMAAVVAAMLLPLAVGHAAADEGRTFYVDYAGGDDANGGRSMDAAFKHSPGDPAVGGEAAGVELQPGDRVRFKGGVSYRGRIATNAAGAPGKPVVYDGNRDGRFGDGRAVLDGSDVLRSWQRVASAEQAGGHAQWRKLYRTTAPAGAVALTANLHQGERMLTLAQHPTPAEPLAIDDHSKYLRVPPDQATETTLRDARLEELGGEALVGAYVMIWRSRNDVDTRRIIAYDAETQTVRFDKLGAPPYDNRDARYAIANAPTTAVLDGPGQYVVLDAEPDDDGRVPVYLWPLDGEDPNEAGVSISLRGGAFELGPAVGHFTIEGFRIQKYRSAIRKVHWDVEHRTSHVTIRDNEITGIRAAGYSNAVYVYRVDDFVAEDNHLFDNPKMRGIALHTGDRPVFRNNRLVRVGRTPLIFYMARDGQIVNNYVAHCRGTHSNGISVYVDSRDILVANNYIYDSNIPFTCNDTTNLTVRNNVFDGSGSQPISFWQGVKGDVLIENNTLVNGGRDSGLYIGGTGDRRGETFEMRMTFRNNIMDGPVMHIMQGSNPLWTTNVDRQHNIYLSAPDDFEPGPGEQVVADASLLFRDFDSRDYRLKPGSPAIDAGLPVEHEADFADTPRPQGEAPDLGAYEYVPDTEAQR